MKEKLTARAVDHAGVDTHGDGPALRVLNSERRSWVFRYQPRGAAREIGLGADLNVSLAAAREKRAGAPQAACRRH